MSEYNVADTEVQEAEAYAERRLKERGKSLQRELPNFARNYLALQHRMTYSLDIERSQMPVIEPKDMGEFMSKIRKGHIDIFAPFLDTSLFPREFVTKRSSSKWLTAGLRDGKITDDVLKVSLTKIQAKSLKPIQSQIWLDVMIDGMLRFGVPRRNSPILNAPIIASKNHYIIDGHHRWGQVMLANPAWSITSVKMPLDIVTLLNMTKSYGTAIGNKPNI